MARNSRLDALRAEARKSHRATTQKISRLKSSNGVEITGSKYDQRVDPQILKRYNARQLEAYIRRMKSFTDRKVQFVPGAYNKPLPRQKWEQLKSEEAKQNAQIQSDFERVANIFLPHKNMTIQQIKDQVIPNVRAMRAGQNKFSPTNRKSKGVVGEKGLDFIIEDLKRKNSKGYERKYAQHIRDNIQGLVEFSQRGDEFMGEIKKLRNDELIALWDLGGLPEILKNDYAQMKMLTEFGPDIEFSEFEENLNDAFEVVNWARKTRKLRR